MRATLIQAVAGLAIQMLPLVAHAQQARDSARPPVLLIVHGRDVVTNDPVKLGAEWSSALNKGLAEAGIDSMLIPPADRRFVYYGNVFGGSADPTRCEGVTFALDATKPSEPASPGNGTLRLAKSFTKFMPSSWRFKLIMPFTPDTKQYIERARPSCLVRNIYRDSLEAQGDRPVVVLAHSQGALLTYEYQANTEGWGHPLAGFVSAGSQFGFDALMLRFGAKGQKDGSGISTPPGVGKVWHNFYDSQDAVAFKMGGRYRKPPFMDDMDEHRVLNPLEFRHTATGYISNPVVALATADAWCRSYTSSKPSGCKAVHDSVGAGNIASQGRHHPDLWSFLSVPFALAPVAGYVLLARRIIR